MVQRFEEQDELYSGLPVVRVADWASLTPALLESEYRRIQEGVARGAISWTKVFLPYWLHRHTAHMRPLI